MNEFIENLCLFSLSIFFFLWPVSFVSVTSIPGIVFLVLLCLDFSNVCEVVRKFRIEILLVLSILILGTLFSELPLKSVKGSYDVLRGSVAFVAVMVLCRHGIEKMKRPFFLASIVSFLVYLVAAICFVALTDETNLRSSVFINNYFGNSNHYATGLAQLGLLNIPLLLDKNKNLLMRVVPGVISVTSLLGVLWSGSRGSLLALLCALFLYLFLFYPGKRLWLLFGGLCSASFFVVAISNNFAREMMPAWLRLGSDIFVVRSDVFLASVTATWEHAKLFGFGINTFKYLDFGQPISDYRFIMPHNIYIELFYSVGLCGAVLSIFLLLRFVSTMHIRGMSNKFFGFFSLSFLAFWLVRGAVDLKLFSPYLPGVLSLTLAVLCLSKNVNFAQIQIKGSAEQEQKSNEKK